MEPLDGDLEKLQRGRERKKIRESDNGFERQRRCQQSEKMVVCCAATMVGGRLREELTGSGFGG